MAINYDGTGGVFTCIGKVVKQINLVATDITTWTTREGEIQTVFEAGSQQVAEDSLIQYVDSIQQSLADIRPTLATICDLRLQDYTTVVDELAIPDNNISTVLYALVNRMVVDSETIDASTVTVGSITAGGSNVGNGTILTTSTLDGYSSPASGASPHPAMNGRLTEYSVSETMTVTCSQDSYTDGTVSGSERFSINGQLPITGAWGVGTEGSGSGPTMSTLQSGTIIQNMNFEDFSTTNVPDSWDIATGAATTNVAQETSGANVYRGLSSVKFIGTGAAASISLFQLVPASTINPLRRYCVTVRYKASATDSGKTFTVKFIGTGYTEGTSEKISIAGASFATTWTLASFFVNMPAVIPSDFGLSIALTGTPTVNLWIDDIGFAPVEWWNGIGFAAVAGSTPFTRYDTFTTAVANDDAGVFQKFFVRNYLQQLPSNNTGAETISDSLAT